jgi:Disulfide bond chaperones of the HSP33 family
MNDQIVRAVAAGGTIRAFAAVTTHLAEDARKVHDASGVAIAALGRTLTAAAIMSKMLKSEKDVLTIQIRGDGPLGSIVAVADAQANVRGYVNNPFVELPLNSRGKFDVGGAVGKKRLSERHKGSWVKRALRRLCGALYRRNRERISPTIMLFPSRFLRLYRWVSL